MTKFVLEILDGERAGTVVPLGEGQVKIGRRPDNDVVIPDEKCSGHHAVLELEDGRHVLRDLDSTNGTMLDGHRVTEIVLSAGDVVQLGRVRVCFRGEGESSGVDDLRVDKVDVARLSHTRKRSSTVLLVALIVVAGGVGAFFAFRPTGGAGGTAGPSVARALEVSGNLLASTAANLEEDGGWELQAVDDAVPFETAIGRAQSHSGSAALVARSPAGDAAAEGDAGRKRPFALAQLAEPVLVTSGTPVEVAAFVRTKGDAQVAVRLWFGSSADDRSVCTGSTPVAATGDWQRVSFAVTVPTGLDRARVQLLALLPGADAEASVDDVALVRVSDAPKLAGDTKNGRLLIGAGSSFRIDGTDQPTLLGVVPLVDDPVLDSLADAGELVPSDAGLQLALEPIDETGFRVSYTGGDAVRGLRLVFPADAQGARTRGAGDDATFVERAPEFDADAVAEILLGSADGRCLIKLDAPAAVHGANSADAYVIDLVDHRQFELETMFADAVRRARDLELQAERAVAEGRPADALSAVRELVDQVPHDPQYVRKALALRGEILAEQENRIREIERDSVSASFFDSRLGYERVVNAVDDLIARYGEGQVQRLDDLKKLRERMQQGLAALDRRAGAAHAEQLQSLAEAFRDAGNDELAKVVQGYVEREYKDILNDSGTPRDGEGNK